MKPARERCSPDTAFRLEGATLISDFLHTKTNRLCFSWELKPETGILGLLLNALVLAPND